MNECLEFELPQDGLIPVEVSQTALAEMLREYRTLSRSTVVEGIYHYMIRRWMSENSPHGFHIIGWVHNRNRGDVIYQVAFERDYDAIAFKVRYG